MRKAILMATAALAFAALPGNGQSRYAEHSVLSTGHWVKIRVSDSGYHMLTDEFLHKAGFSDPSKVEVWGYGGAMQPELLTAKYLADTDDLKQIPIHQVGGRRIFRAEGPVTWSASSETLRTRNPYSNYGYYFLTDSNGQPTVADSASFVELSYPKPNDYHAIYETDEYSWYHGGRNLFEKRLLSSAEEISYTLPAYSSAGKVTVAMTYEGYCNADVYVNGEKAGSILVSSTTASKNNKKLKSMPDDYSKATVDTWVFDIKGGLKESNTVTLRQTQGGQMRLDYIVLSSKTPKPVPSFSADALPVPELVGEVENQDLHADPQADMVIIIPANRNFTTQAKRLKELHQTHDGLRVNIVAADQLYNEFSSGTPDANAYRRYMKMLYDRAGDDKAQRPRFLLLFGDGAWDNRMCSEKWLSTSPDDFLLCYESENSFSETKCYVSDDYFCLLDDGEGADMVSDKIDAAVGRFPARTAEEADIVVNKTISYVLNAEAGAWQNTIIVMGDDGDKNRHMDDAERVAEMVKSNYPGYNVKKILWDSYPEKKTAAGNQYPEVVSLIKEQMQIGALIMNYSGHGGATNLSHEFVLKYEDFTRPTSLRLPLWITASCDVMPFDGQDYNLGDGAMFNPEGGAVAFFGTTRTVYAAWNRPLNLSFMKHVLGSTDGVPNTIGQAAFMAKNEFTVGSSRDMIVNKQQYTFLGDPAVRLVSPQLRAVVDKINGIEVTDETNVMLPVGEKVVVSGHIEGQDHFQGVVNFVVKDAERSITCLLNNPANLETDTAMVYRERLETIYAGSNSVRDGQFEFVFTVPKDIAYSEATGQMLLFAYSDDRSLLAHGDCKQFTLSGGNIPVTDGVGPRIYSYLENESFTNGGIVGAEPRFYAMIADNEGINTSDAAIGHNIELCIDGKFHHTYNLNPYFTYSFGDYTSGTVNFRLPALSLGQHRLHLRAWDVMNNSGDVEYTFVVADRGIAAIDEIEDVKSENSKYYDLQGRRIAGNASGSQIVLKRDSQGKVRKMIAAGK